MEDAIYMAWYSIENTKNALTYISYTCPISLDPSMKSASLLLSFFRIKPSTKAKGRVRSCSCKAKNSTTDSTKNPGHYMHQLAMHIFINLHQE